MSRYHSLARDTSRPMLKDVLAASEVAFGRLFDVHGRQCNKTAVLRRHALMYVARNLTHRSLPQIGTAFHRDWSTVSDAVVRMHERIATDKEAAALVKTLEDITLDIWRARSSQPAEALPQPRRDCLS